MAPTATAFIAWTAGQFAGGSLHSCQRQPTGTCTVVSGRNTRRKSRAGCQTVRIAQPRRVAELVQQNWQSSDGSRNVFHATHRPESKVQPAPGIDWSQGSWSGGTMPIGWNRRCRDEELERLGILAGQARKPKSRTAVVSRGSASATARRGRRNPNARLCGRGRVSSLLLHVLQLVVIVQLGTEASERGFKRLDQAGLGRIGIKIP